MTENVYEALFELQGKLRGVTRDSSNPHFKNRYASLEQVTDTIRPHMQELGLLWLQKPGTIHDGCIEVETMIVHVKSQTNVSSSMLMPLAKRDPQGAGSALTYAMRYSLMAVLGLPPTDDDAETAIDRTESRPEPEKQAPKSQEAREAYAYLQKDLRAIGNVDDLRRWWDDGDVKELRRKIPEDWQRELRQEWEKTGKAMSKANAKPVGDVVADIQKQFPGSKVVGDKFVDNFLSASDDFNNGMNTLEADNHGG